MYFLDSSLEDLSKVNFSVVDRALQVVDAYHDKINKFERDVLVRPKVKTIRHCTLLAPLSNDC